MKAGIELSFVKEEDVKKKKEDFDSHSLAYKCRKSLHLDKNTIIVAKLP